MFLSQVEHSALKKQFSEANDLISRLRSELKDAETQLMEQHIREGTENELQKLYEAMERRWDQDQKKLGLKSQEMYNLELEKQKLHSQISDNRLSMQKL